MSIKRLPLYDKRINKIDRNFIFFLGKSNELYIKYLKNSCNKLKLNFYGHIKQEKLLNLIIQYDIMIFPSV